MIVAQSPERVTVGRRLCMLIWETMTRHSTAKTDLGKLTGVAMEDGELSVQQAIVH